MKPDLVSHQSIVAKSNISIELIRKYELSELRLIHYCLAHYDSRTNDNRHITARVDDLIKIFPSMDTKSAYAVVRRAMLQINSKPAEFEDELTSYFLNWFTGFKYYKGTGEFTFSISPEMVPFLTDIQGYFTKYRLADVYQFKSAATWKLYENLAQWRKAKRWAVDLDELRFKLGVAGKYPKWAIFNRDVVSPATAEINAVSDLQAEYHQEKRGRRIVGLVFKIQTKKVDGTIDLEPPEDELHRRLLEAGVNAKTAAEYAREINRQGKADRILARLPGIIERARDNAAKCPMAKYVLGSIRDELSQGKLFEVVPPIRATVAAATPEPEHKPALDCWHDHRQRKEPCTVRTAGAAPKEEKCKICLTKIPTGQFDV